MDITEEILIKTDPALKKRKYQREAILKIFPHSKCLVKMFCGTGKSRIISNITIHEKKNLNIIVFPSLSLINQFTNDYIFGKEYKKHFTNYKTLNISTEQLCNIKSTTDETDIKEFLKNKESKIVLITYQSYHVLIKCLDDIKNIKNGLVCYDEAHHVVSPEYKKLIFEKKIEYFEKEVYFTATPKNENNVIMFDRDEPQKNMCGVVAYEYTYLQGLYDEFLNAFDVCIDMYTENTNISIYEAISRAILERETNRVLSFHAGVNGESNTNVKKFVKPDEFIKAFHKVQENEFPNKKDYYKKFTFKGIDGKTPSGERKSMLNALDKTSKNEIYIISSCETIGEGIDTKKANMCVFADPKTSITKIIQNIGRIVRPNKDSPVSTILIPCFINMENYIEANGDEKKQDELIRSQMRDVNGDYASILNVLGALKQEDPDLYDMCLNYPNRILKEESLEEQGFMIDDGDEYTETYTTIEVEDMKNTKKIPIEIHTNETIERFNEENKEKMIRLYYDEEEKLYSPIVCIENEDDEDDEDDEDNDEDEDENGDRKIIQLPKKKPRINLSIRQNDDIQMLWKVKDSLDFNKKFCSVIIDCEVSYGIEKWINTLEKLKLYIDENQKRPNKREKDPIVKKIGIWIGTQKKNYHIDINLSKQIMKTPGIHKLWTELLQDKKYKEYLVLDPITDWKEKCKKLIQYIDENKKRPINEDKDPVVKTLGKWVSTQKGNYNIDINQSKYIMTTQEIHKLWTELLQDKKYKEYLVLDSIGDWKEKYNKVKLYMDKNKKTPGSTDKDLEIKKLGSWIGTQKQQYHIDIEQSKNITKTPELHKLWTELLQEKKYGKYLDSIIDWKGKYIKLKLYIDENKKTPKQNDKDPVVKTLGKWVLHQKENYNIDINQSKEIMKKPEIHKLWAELLQDKKYKEYLVLDPIVDWKENYNKLKLYIDENKKRPINEDKDPVVKTLGKWVSTQKGNYNIDINQSKYIMTTQEIHKLWTELLQDKKYKEYLVLDSIGDWKEKYKKLIQYMDKNQKTPFQKDKDPVVKTLGKWVSHQKTNYNIDINQSKQIMTTLEIHKLWTELLQDKKYKEYLVLDPIGDWKEKYNEVKLYMDKNQKTPKSNDKDPVVKILGYWVSNQKTNYNIDINQSKYIMTTPEIHKLWEEFMINYCSYFKSKIIDEIVSKLTTKNTIVEEPIQPKSIIKKQTAITLPIINDNKVEHKFPEASIIGNLHKTYHRMKADTLNTKFKNNPELWKEYHTIRKETFASYEPKSIPSNMIIYELEKIKTKRQKIVVDMGCGEAQIAHHFNNKNDKRFTFHNYDHQSGGDSIISEVDISSLPLENDSVEITIMSLALWGTKANCIQYIKEAYRVLESGGKFYISDSTKKWSPELITPENGGLYLRELLIEHGFTIINETIGKPFCLFVCNKIY